MMVLSTIDRNYDQLEQIVKKLLEKHPTYQLYVTGHSLGGALATLYSYMLSSKIDQSITVMTFGSPRVGNYKFADSFMKKEYNSLSNNKWKRYYNSLTNNQLLSYWISHYTKKSSNQDANE